MHTDCDYPNLWRVTYDGGATFIPVCEVCHQFVKPDKKVFCGDDGLSPLPNATCKKCGRTRMHFEGFMPSIHNQDDD